MDTPLDLTSCGSSCMIMAGIEQITLTYEDIQYEAHLWYCCPYSVEIDHCCIVFPCKALRDKHPSSLQICELCYFRVGVSDGPGKAVEVLATS